ncbi:hypothetical protein L2E82_40295 [Cichorium intybus]|uniref:Uncharacterized protein n=1 Tax=Cichorium intybus TaxID=13427 RepID=A0ACB9AJY7_CICIN|nr:hypothetical protein L2E82_40295 [Cichorium intybus]
MSLLNDHQKVFLKQARVHLLDTEPFDDAFGPKGKRKRPKVVASDYEALAKRADGSQDAFEEKHGDDPVDANADGFRDLVRHTMFEKGQSKRIWGELYKVIDSSDVVIQVLDARDPQGTRCHHLEKHLKEHCKHKHMILLLNKVSDKDLETVYVETSIYMFASHLYWDLWDLIQKISMKEDELPTAKQYEISISHGEVVSSYCMHCDNIICHSGKHQKVKIHGRLRLYKAVKDEEFDYVSAITSNKKDEELEMGGGGAFVPNKKVKPNIETDDGITPLLSAVAAGSLPCLELLIQLSSSYTSKLVINMMIMEMKSWKK